MYYPVIKHSGHLRTLEKCKKHSPAARVVYISLVFSNARRVLSQCNTLISAGCHWVKLITCHKIRLWLSDDIRRPILFRPKRDQETSNRSSQTFNRSWKTKTKKNKKYFLQKPVTEKLKSWLTIPYKETRKNPQNMQEWSTCVHLEKLIGAL